MAAAVDEAGGQSHAFRAALLLDVEGVQDRVAAEKVEAALRQVRGVRAASVSVERRQATVEFTAEGRATLKQLTEAVQRTGFRVRPTPPEKRKRAG